MWRSVLLPRAVRPGALVCPWSSGKKICHRVPSFTLVRLTGLRVPGLLQGVRTEGGDSTPAHSPKAQVPCSVCPGRAVRLRRGLCVHVGVQWALAGCAVCRPLCGEGPLAESPCRPGGPGVSCRLVAPAW